MLFSLEEASSFWSIQLTWRVFITATVCTYSLNLIRSLAADVNYDSPSLIIFGEFPTDSYVQWELLIFILIAIFGGLVGALFNYVNEKISVFRRNHLAGKKFLKVGEALLVAFITATVLFWIPAIYDTCSDIQIFYDQNN